jgi:hypothetical protein
MSYSFSSDSYSNSEQEDEPLSPSESPAKGADKKTIKEEERR